MTKPKYWKQAKVFYQKDKVLKKLILKYRVSKTRKDPFFHYANP